MAKDRSPKVVSKKHLARLERERRQTTIITVTAIAVLVLVFLMIGYGILSQTVLFARQPITRVNKDVMTTHEFQVRVKIARQQLINQYFQDQQLAQMFGMDPSSYLTQIQNQLDDPATLGNQAIRSAQESMVIRQYALANNLRVTAEDIDHAKQEAFGYYPSGTPTLTPTATAFAYSTLNATQLFLAPPTATPTELPTESPTATPEISPTPAASPTPTQTFTPTSAASATPTASPTPYTLGAYQTQYQNARTFYNKFGMSQAEFERIFFEDQLYRQRVEDKIMADLTHTQEQVWARHILVADQATADKVRGLLVSGGDWTSLASQYSTDTGTKDKGGDLGWFAKGAMVAEFESAAYALPMSEISQPIQTTYGFHIIQVLGHENRPLTASEFQAARDKGFQDWLTGQISAATVTVYDYWKDRVPTSPTVAEETASLQQTQAAGQGQATP
jgi:hypothetical protein